MQEHWEHRSFKELGMEQQPTIHLGPIASALERQGIRTEKGDVNRAIMEQNRILLAARRAYSAAAMAVRQLESMVTAQAAAAKNEVLELIDCIMEKKGKLYLPLVGAPYFHKAPHREILLDAENVNKFVVEQKIDSFEALDAYAKEQEKSQKETEKLYLSKSEKLRRLQTLSAAFAAYQPYMEVRKKYRSLTGIKAVLYEKQHKAELEKGDRMWENVKRLLMDGDGMSPKQWDVQIKKLTGECKELSSASGERLFRLAFVDVIRYNRKMYEAEKRREIQNLQRKEQVVKKSRRQDMEL